MARSICRITGKPTGLPSVPLPPAPPAAAAASARAASAFSCRRCSQSSSAPGENPRSRKNFQMSGISMTLFRECFRKISSKCRTSASENPARRCSWAAWYFRERSQIWTKSSRFSTAPGLQVLPRTGGPTLPPPANLARARLAMCVGTPPRAASRWASKAPWMASHSASRCSRMNRRYPRKSRLSASRRSMRARNAITSRSFVVWPM
mmetsp:Transcript_120984/g.342751  ORF Transcript_120984/g.342751 Transcript_120984/m.342751 type:complete len:207 (+) Transcript_120984:252-872(+)